MYWAQCFHVYAWMVIVCGFCKASQCIANQLNITGGEYQSSTYSNSFVIRETSYTGPKGCIKECLYQNGCDAVNYKTSHTCELLSTKAGDEKWTKQYSFFSEIADWKMEENQCWPNPCAADERCVVAKLGNYVCLSVENGCSMNPCLYGGSCRNTVVGIRCACTVGYSGDRCEITPCQSSPCYYAGTCTPDGPSYKCTCANGYSGTRCQVTPCHSDPCLNQGTCKPNGSGYICSCKTNYSGVRCGNTPCSNSPCINGGTCNLIGDWYSCECKSGFSGTTCQYTPCSNNPCLNGGTCAISGSSFQCTCLSTHYGDICQNAYAGK